MVVLKLFKNIKTKEYKVLYQRIWFTLMVMTIYILGSRIVLPGMKIQFLSSHSFLDLALSNVGGDIRTLNLFSLGLGPWFITVIMMTLFNYRNIDKGKLQTRLERHIKERLFTLLLAIFQGCFLLSQYRNEIHLSSMYVALLLLILVAGTMFLVWLVDQNTIYGIAGPTPIVLIGIIKSIFQQQQHLAMTMVMIVAVSMVIVLVLIIWLERIEYRIRYRDMMNVTTSKKDIYISWKLNPAGSLAVMFHFSLFSIIVMLVQWIGKVLTRQVDNQLEFLELAHTSGILLFLVTLFLLNYILSKVMLNTKRKAKDFQKSGNYIEGIYPGKQTEKYLNRRASIVSAWGAVALSVIIGLPLLISIVIPDMANQLSILTQFIIMIYMTVHITETVRTYLYFDQYQPFLDRYCKE
ncbi:TPA: accessory Sec system protein translocase subunit SecY2 [Staphylococcus delphini]|nr:accessory Sec system protein translocase subunit SecY2 [Staphylococcus delphini]HEC2188891.1 accessory Sec system protein translocase subunit SecY2 [Staphylococcus delphini]HEC2191962.1 accessory Sec system protein translocase subunit SecY2 [Staphylococcus delphini]HEC2200669.1 accessory Sec system protein translocase subunit SecY2 [Staphylococcus delphini]HEC2224732.1 accessory Sec system protein translocase subunit SecY2 [Staphylococcus delphini]